MGAFDDAAKGPDPIGAIAGAVDAGFQAVALSAVWTRGEQAPPAAELAQLRGAARAAVSLHVEPIVTVYQLSNDTPVSDADQADFAAFAAAIAKALPEVRALIVGNEPNTNLFWMPQFGPEGSDAAAEAFERLLARTYDAIKAVDSGVQVIAAGLSAHGGDDSTAVRPTHSPTQFLLDLGAAYRSSGRTTPMMDALSLHPYGEAPKVPPTLAHPRTTTIGIADYGKLVDLLGQAFDGTAQPGRTLPIVFGEYGVETTIPRSKASLYSGHEVVTPVDERTQGRFYADAIRLAACEPTVELLLVFHVLDEPRLEGLQSGVRYTDGSPKSSLPTVRQAIAGDTTCRR